MRSCLTASKDGRGLARIWPGWPRRSHAQYRPEDQKNNPDDQLPEPGRRQAGEHVRQRRGPLRRPDPRVRRGGDRGAGCAVRPGRRVKGPGRDAPAVSRMRFRERMRRLVAAGLLPERAGQPVKVLARISLTSLMALDGNSALQEEWTDAGPRRPGLHTVPPASVGGQRRRRVAGRRHRPAAMACDAAMTPIVVPAKSIPPPWTPWCGSASRSTDSDPLPPLRLPFFPPPPPPPPPPPLPPCSGESDDRQNSDNRTDIAPRQRHRPHLGGPGAGHHWQSGHTWSQVRAAWRASCAARAARRPARRAEPAGHRLQQLGPGRDPHAVTHATGTAAGPAAPPARRRLRGAPRQAQEERRQDQHQGLRPALFLPPPGRDSPDGAGPWS